MKQKRDDEREEYSEDNADTTMWVTTGWRDVPRRVKGSQKKRHKRSNLLKITKQSSID